MKALTRVFFLFIIFNSLLMAKYIDLGYSGYTYPILEENFMKMLKREFQKNWHLTREKAIQELVAQIKIQANGHTSLPYCQALNRKIALNQYILPVNLYNPVGRIWKHKGEIMTVNNKIPLNLCFIKVNNLKDAEKQIKYFDELVKKIHNNKNAKCIYMVAGINVLKLDKKFGPRMFYPVNINYEKYFNVTCYPSLVRLKNQYKVTFDIPINQVYK